MLWCSAGFSADGEHVAAAMASKTSHVLYVWSMVYGNMERILEGEGWLGEAGDGSEGCEESGDVDS